MSNGHWSAVPIPSFQSRLNSVWSEFLILMRYETMKKIYIIKQVRLHDGISQVRWAVALMEVRSLFGLNSAVEKKNAWRNDPHTESRVRD